MAVKDKSSLWRIIKDNGYPVDKHYREYSVEDLEAIILAAVTPVPDELEASIVKHPAGKQIPVTSQGAEHAGLNTNTHSDEEPLRIDPETGFLWYRDEVPKAAYPKPRGRRILKYNDPGVKTVTTKIGEYTETFEMPGDDNRVSEARITLPSYQVGLYRNPQLPFRVHTYNGNEGYDLLEVEAYYGGAERVPSGVKRKYVSNVLCYDIRSVNQAIETEYRERVLNVKR